MSQSVKLLTGAPGIPSFPAGPWQRNIHVPQIYWIKVNWIPTSWQKQRSTTIFSYKKGSFVMIYMISTIYMVKWRFSYKQN